MTGQQRNTWQRDAVRDALRSGSGFTSARALHAGLRAAGSAIALATVYRALADLAESGDADSLLSDQGEALYRACASALHHHHLICRSCGLTIEIEADAVETWAAGVAAQHGFTRPHHTVDVFGTCTACEARVAGESGHP